MTPSKLPLTLKLGAGLSGALLLMALISMIYTPYNPEMINIGARFTAPGWPHLFGTDQLGRDVFSIIMTGAQTSLMVAVIAVALGMALGVPLGLLAAANPGVSEDLVSRGNDIVFAFPVVILAILIAAVSGPGIMSVIWAIGIFNIPVFAQVTRGAARIIWTQDYILSARVVGKSRLQISIEHILPNVFALILIQAAIQLSLAITAEAALSYIGLGAQPPTPSWGRMLNESQTLFGWAPWLSIFPGLVIVLSVLGLNLLGEGLREVLDPQLKARSASR
jgi:peptide/nickel transport system permease protein